MKLLFFTLIILFTNCLSIEVFKLKAFSEIQVVKVSADEEFGLQLEYNAETLFDWEIEQPSPRLINTESFYIEDTDNNEGKGKAQFKQFNFVARSLQKGKNAYLRFALIKPLGIMKLVEVEVIVILN